MNNNQKIKSVIYARVSSREQEETGYSLGFQEKFLSDYADRKDLQIIKKFRISESASGKNQRITFNEMITYMNKNNINVLICEKVDRLTRNFKDAIVIDEWLDENGAREVHLVKDSLVLHRGSKSQEKLNWGIRILFAKNYTDNLSEEVKKGQLQKIREGWYPTKPPIGYKIIGERGHKINVIDEDTAPFIKKMFSLYSTGNYSLNSLGEELYKIGFRNRNKNKIAKSHLHRLLSDPFYFGSFRWNGKEYKGNHDPIISKPLFDEVQHRLNGGIMSPYFAKHKTELKGKILCGSCSKTVTWEKQKGQWYGGCKQCKAKLSIKTKYIKQTEIEKELLNKIVDIAPKNDSIIRVLEKALKENHQEEIEYNETQVRTINNKLERIRQRVQTMYDDKLDGRISTDFYDEKLEQFNQEQDVLLDSLKRLKNDNTAYYEAGFAVHHLATKARSIYISNKATLEDRRLILSYAFSNISILEGKIKVEYTKAFQFLSDWMPSINKSLELQNTVVNKKQKGVLTPSCPNLLALLNQFRTFDWAEEYKYPTVILSQMKELLAEPQQG